MQHGGWQAGTVLMSGDLAAPPAHQSPWGWDGREAEEEEASGKQPRWSGLPRPGRVLVSQRGGGPEGRWQTVLAAPQGLPGRLKFLSSINYVLQIKIATQRTLKIALLTQPLLGVLWERVCQLDS